MLFLHFQILYNEGVSSNLYFLYFHYFTISYIVVLKPNIYYYSLSYSLILFKYLTVLMYHDFNLNLFIYPICFVLVLKFYIINQCFPVDFINNVDLINSINFTSSLVKYLIVFNLLIITSH